LDRLSLITEIFFVGCRAWTYLKEDLASYLCFIFKKILIFGNWSEFYKIIYLKKILNKNSQILNFKIKSTGKN
jgi:hypothetical protein